MASQEQRVLQFLQAQPMASQQAVAEALNMSRNAVAGHISRLMKKGLIEGKGYVFPQPAYWVVVGGANLDCQGTALGPLDQPDSYPGNVRDTAGGVGRNIAENLARLGLATQLVSVVGQDAAGDWLLEHCLAAGIDTRGISRLANQATSRYLSIVDPQGVLQLAIADMAIIDQLAGALLAKSQKQRSHAQGLVLDCNLSAKALQAIFSASPLPPVYVDAVSHTKATRLAPFLHQVHTLKLNRSEAQALLGAALSDEAIIHALRSRGVTQVLLSLGADGLCYGDAQGLITCPSRPIAMVSDNGAGDALLSGFILAQTRGLSREDCLAWAQACAEITLQYPGANHPELSAEKVTSWLKK